MDVLDGISRLVSMTRAVLALVGMATVVTIAWPAAREVVVQVASGAQAATPADPVRALPVAPAEFDPMPMQEAASEPESAEALEQRTVAAFISRRYRVADEASRAFVQAAYREAGEHALDPLLILAVVAIESRFNPVAESSMGAMGLMQVIPRFHPEKVEPHGGDQALLDPEINIQVGALILREYLGRFGELEPALQKYAGAFDEPTAQYTAKVLAERARLQRVVPRARREA